MHIGAISVSIHALTIQNFSVNLGERKMEIRPIDANALQELCNRGIQNMWNTGVAPVSWAAAYADFKNDIDSIPTLTPPNEGAKGKNVPANEPLTLEELKAEAKRQGYKLIKDENIKFERCLCGETRHEWWS